MKLQERLRELIGHEVWIMSMPESSGNDGTMAEATSFCGGTLHEIGYDYLLVRSDDGEDGIRAIVGAEWFIAMAKVYGVIHSSDCPKCAVEAVSSKSSWHGCHISVSESH